MFQIAFFLTLEEQLKYHYICAFYLVISSAICNWKTSLLKQFALNQQNKNLKVNSRFSTF